MLLFLELNARPCKLRWKSKVHWEYLSALKTHFVKQSELRSGSIKANYVSSSNNFSRSRAASQVMPYLITLICRHENGWLQEEMEKGTKVGLFCTGVVFCIFCIVREFMHTADRIATSVSNTPFQMHLVMTCPAHKADLFVIGNFRREKCSNKIGSTSKNAALEENAGWHEELHDFAVGYRPAEGHWSSRER